MEFRKTGLLRLMICAIYGAFIVTTSAGCVTSLFATANVTYPVLVGPVDRIGGKPAVALWTCEDLVVNGLSWGWVAVGSGGSGTGYGDYDSSLMFDAAILLSEQQGRSRRVELTEVSTGSMNGGLVFVLSGETWNDVRFRLCGP